LNHGQIQDKFFLALPLVIVNPRPASNYSSASNTFNSICRNDSEYPWAETSGYVHPLNLLPFMRHISGPAMKAHMKDYFNRVVNTTLYIPIKFSGMEVDSPSLSDTLTPYQIAMLPAY
jgi:hypothetical protein